MSDDVEKCPCCGESGKIINAVESTSMWTGIDASIQSIAKPAERIAWVLIATRDGDHLRLLSNATDQFVHSALRMALTGCEQGNGVKDIDGPAASNEVH
jgi:hypothetical protein